MTLPASGSQETRAGFATHPTPPSEPDWRTPAKRRLPLRLKFLYFLWIVILFEPQWWIASVGPDSIRQVPTLLFGLFLFLVVLNLARGVWHPPLLALFLFMLATTPFTYDVQYAIEPLKQIFLYYVLTIGTLTFVRRPREAVPIVLLVLLYQFIWWCAHGAWAGRVPWHYANSNYDGFGPLMVMGLAGCIYCGLALTSRRLKMAALLTAAACVVGLMSSFARGAVLSGGLVLAFAWLRIPRKGWATAGAILLALVVGFTSVTMLSDVDRGDATGSFLAEMATISRDIDEGTGADRRALWAAARKVFAARPFTGVGARNFGVYAATHFDIGEAGGAYAANPATLYDRALHSSYFQVLCEFGLIGSALYLWLLVDFWRRNTLLRTKRYRVAWKAATDGTTELRYISLGLESMMVGFLATAFFYDQLFVPWLYTILAVNVLLEMVIQSTVQPQSTAARRLRRTAGVES